MLPAFKIAGFSLCETTLIPMVPTVAGARHVAATARVAGVQIGVSPEHVRLAHRLGTRLQAVLDDAAARALAAAAAAAAPVDADAMPPVRPLAAQAAVAPVQSGELLPLNVLTFDQAIRYRTTGNVWQTTPKQCLGVRPCTAPETIRFVGDSGCFADV